MHPLFANKFFLSLGRQRKRLKINPLTNIFLLLLHLFEPGTLFWGVFLKNLYFFTFTSLLIWTRDIKMHTHFPDFQKFFIYPLTCLNWEQKSQGISAKNLQKNKVPRFSKVQKTKDRIRKNIKL